MLSKTMFFCVILVQSTLGFPKIAGFDPTKISGSFLQPTKDIKEKQIIPVVGLFGAPLGEFSKGTHGIAKRASDLLEPIKEAKDKQVPQIFGFFRDQFEKISKVFNVLGSPSSSSSSNNKE